MEAPERERLLAAIDVELTNPRLARIQRVRLLDLWWRVATDGRPHEANLQHAEMEFLARLLDRIPRLDLTGTDGADPIFQPVGSIQSD
jgi:hypothetical protein